MNKINVNIKKDEREPTYGSLWRDENDNNAHYILAQTSSGKYACIGLDDGNRWGDPTNTIAKATDGLIFIAHEFEMSINTKQ